ITRKLALRLVLSPNRLNFFLIHFVILFKMYPAIEFFTATCLNWQPLLGPDKHKQIVMESLSFLVKAKRIWLYGYVLMPNHLHLLWNKQDAWVDKSIQQQFLKYTAQQIKFNLIANYPPGTTKIPEHAGRQNVPFLGTKAISGNYE
ncbi:MAG TPA: hypothetical protein VGD31_09385, partial [Sphingobacteriaceae bacterium]